MTHGVFFLAIAMRKYLLTQCLSPQLHTSANAEECYGACPTIQSMYWSAVIIILELFLAGIPYLEDW